MYHARPNHNQIASGFRTRVTTTALPRALKPRNAAASGSYYYTDGRLTKDPKPARGHRLVPNTRHVDQSGDQMLSSTVMPPTSGRRFEISRRVYD